MSAAKLASFLAAHDRCVIATELNCAVVFYAFFAPNVICFISSRDSVHAQALKARFCDAVYENSKLNKAAQIKARAPISVAIYEDERWCGLCAQARVVETTSAMKEQFLAKYPAARLAVAHEIYALEICWAKFKDLKGLRRWEYELI